MKNIFLLPLLLVLVVGCDRLKMDDSAKIQIQLPAAGTHTKVATSSVNGVRPVPNGMDASAAVTTPINCYIVGVGVGPDSTETEMKRNICARDDGSRKFTIGQWSGGIPAGGTISLDVTSGKNRSFYLIGLHAVGNTCADFTKGFPEDEVLSKPYLLGKSEGVSLSPGETKELEIRVAFDADGWFDDCVGLDFPPKNHNGGPSNPGNPGGPVSPIVPTQIKLSKEYFPHNILPISNPGNCQAIDVSLVDGAGQQGLLPSPVSFTLTSTGGSIVMFSSMETCSLNTPSINTYSLPASTYHGQVYVRASGSPGSSTVIQASSISYAALTSLPLTATLVGTYTKTLEIDSPPSLLSGMCYPVKFNLRYAGEGYNSPESGGLPITVQNTGVDLYSNSSCNTVINALNVANSGSTVSAYIKASSVSTAASLTLSAAGYTTATKNIPVGSGSTLPFAIQVNGPNKMQGVGTCFSGYRAMLVNDRNTPVIAPPGQSMALTSSNVYVTLHSTGVCNTSAPTGFVAGEYMTDFFVRNNDVNGYGNIQLSTNSNLAPIPYQIYIDGPKQFMVTTSTPSVASGTTCVRLDVAGVTASGNPVSSFFRDFKISFTNSDMTINSYTDPGCTASDGVITSGPTGKVYFGSDTVTQVYMKITNTGSAQTLFLDITDTVMPNLLPGIMPLQISAP